MIRNFVTAAALAATVVLPSAAQSLEWKLNNNFAESRIESKLLRDYAEDVTKRTGGNLKLTAYSGGALGLKDADALKWLSAGAADMGVVISAYLGRDAPDLNAAYVQGVVLTHEEHVKALPELKKIFVEFLERWKLVPVAYIRVPIWKISVFCRKDPINTLAQLKSRKLRVWSRDLIETFKGLGVSAQIVPQNEMYVALQTGVIDCTAYGNRLAHTVSLPEVTKQVSFLFPVATMPFVVATSKAKWDALAPDLQRALLDAGAALEQASIKDEWDPAAEDAALIKLRESGVTVLPDFPAEDRNAFTASARKTWQQLAEGAGPQAAAWRLRILKVLDDK